jgi:S-formylglutathione hydrolase FrmB
MWNRISAVAGFILIALATGPAFTAEPDKNVTDLRFEITLAKGVTPAAPDGRLLLVLSREPNGEPRQSIGDTGVDAAPFLGVDAKGINANSKIVVDQKAAMFPIANLAKLPPGEYRVQAVFHSNRDLNLHDAPGNLYSDPVTVKLDPASGGVVKLELTHQIPDEQLPEETEYVKYVKIKSELLSKFHGRPMYLRAGVILPRDFDKDKDRTYPLFVRIGGYGTRYTVVEAMMEKGAYWRKLWLADKTPRMLFLHLDGAGPYGDPYQVNSANNGPYGDAVTQELIPYVEKKFRGIGQSYARVVEGHSTGGWVSLALQIFYPDFFNGCWSFSPDPVDFRAYELIDIYSDKNAYVNKHGFERPAKREISGDTVYDVRHECLLEVVLGRSDRWELSGKDWCAWNAVYGPRGADGLPKPLWDGKTGKIDPSVVEHWQQYDLRRVLQKNWQVLGPKLKGKIHISSGEADDYFLNNAVHLLDDFLTLAKPAFEGRITYGPRRDHSWRAISHEQMFDEMAAAIEKGRKEQAAPKP